MGLLNGKVAIITGAGRGLGREEALALAKEGCNLLINDLGASFDGSGNADGKVADKVVAEIKALGVNAVANYDSVTDFNKAKAMIDQAVSELGRLDIVINNAGFLRDRMIFNMSEAEFDDLIAVHLKGTFNMSRHAASYFRLTGKADPTFKGRIINTASDAGLLYNVGQSNYGAAKAGVAAFTVILSRELRKYATVNCIVPLARTRLTTEAAPNMVEIMNTKSKSGMDIYNPANVAPMVTFLASDAASDITGELFRIAGDTAWVFTGWSTVNKISNNGKIFTPQILADRVKSELMKDLPPKSSLAEALKELLDG